MFNILCQFVPVFMYVSYKSDSSFLSSLLHHDHFLVFYQTPPSHNKMHQQAWPAVILFNSHQDFLWKILCEMGHYTVILHLIYVGLSLGTKLNVLDIHQ